MENYELPCEVVWELTFHLLLGAKVNNPPVHL